MCDESQGGGALPRARTPPCSASCPSEPPANIEKTSPRAFPEEKPTSGQSPDIGRREIGEGINRSHEEIRLTGLVLSDFSGELSRKRTEDTIDTKHLGLIIIIVGLERPVRVGHYFGIEFRVDDGYDV